MDENHILNKYLINYLSTKNRLNLAFKKTLYRLTLQYLQFYFYSGYHRIHHLIRIPVHKNN